MSSPALASPVRSYRDVERLLLSRVRDVPRPYAERAGSAGRAVRALLDRVDRPQDALAFLHIAGSKGKGSVALMAECLLRDAGERVGTYTSPHLRRWNERARVDASPASDATLAAALETLRPHVAALDAAGDDDAPGFFDLITAAALLLFARAGCRVVVLEAGLGGLLDATNVVTPLACCITSIELEHTDKLGHTLGAIARHKAGIIKAGVPVVTGPLPRAALAEVEARLRATGAPERRLGRDWWLESEPARGTSRRVHYRERDGDPPYAVGFTLPHPAPHMAVNAGLALALTRAAGYAPSPRALADCALPARAQVLGARPWVVVDGAHTAASLRALASSLAAIPAARRHFLVSATRGKDLGPLAELLRGAERVTVTAADPLRSAPADEMAHALHAIEPDLPLRSIESPGEAIAAATAALPPDALLCICGSVYLAGRALEVLDA